MDLAALDVETGDPDVDARLREALFLPAAEQVTIGPRGEAELRMRWAEGDLEAEKTLRFLAPGYLVQVGAEVRRGRAHAPRQGRLGAGSR